MPKLPIEHGVVISYIPLYDEEPPLDLKPGDSWNWLQERGVPGRASGLAWQIHPEPLVCFVMEHGMAIGQHLLRWSCGSPETHFDCFYHTDDDCYAISLMPNLALARMQYTAAQFHLNRRSLAHTARLEFVYRPIFYAAFGLQTFRSMRIPNNVRLGITEPQPGGLPPPIVFPEQMPFRNAKESPASLNFLKAVLDDMRAGKARQES